MLNTKSPTKKEQRLSSVEDAEALLDEINELADTLLPLRLDIDKVFLLGRNSSIASGLAEPNFDSVISYLSDSPRKF